MTSPSVTFCILVAFSIFFIFFFFSFGAKSPETPYNKYPTFLPGLFRCQAQSLPLKHLPASTDGCSIQLLSSGFQLHSHKALKLCSTFSSACLSEDVLLSPGYQSYSVYKPLSHKKKPCHLHYEPLLT